MKKSKYRPNTTADISQYTVSEIFILAQHEGFRFLISREFLFISAQVKFIGTAEDVHELPFMCAMITGGEAERPLNYIEKQKGFLALLEKQRIREKLSDWKIYREDEKKSAPITGPDSEQDDEEL